MPLPLEIYSAESVRRIDHNAINDADISGYTLMTRAAQASLDVTLEAYPEARRWQVICGAGNNAGDGYVLARLASQQGVAVSVLTLTSTDKLSGDAATALHDFAAEGGAVGECSGTLDEQAALLIDAIVGSGLQRDIEERVAREHHE